MANVNPGPATTSTASSLAVMTPVNTQTNPGPQQGLNGLRLLAVARAVNLNVTGDVAVMPVINAGTWSVLYVIVTNASISLTTAQAGLFTAAAAGGTAIVANAALSACTSAAIVSQRTIASTNAFSGQNLYFNVGTAQGAAATADVFVLGFDLS